MSIELNNKSELVFHLEDSNGDKILVGMSLSRVEELCAEHVYESLETACTESGCNNESQNFCDCGSQYEDYEIKSMSIKQH